jgi:hypothetical protein
MKQIFLTSIFIQLFIINIKAQNATYFQKEYVIKKYPQIGSLINDFENNTIKKVEFINQLYIQLADTSLAKIQPNLNKISFQYPQYLSNYIFSTDFKVFKSPPPLYKGDFYSQKDSLRFSIYKGLYYLNLMSSADSVYTKFSHIDSIIKVSEFINADTIVKFTNFSVTDRAKINKIYLDCLILRDDYRDAKGLGYNNMTDKAKEVFRKEYKSKTNYIQYFDYLDKLKK